MNNTEINVGIDTSLALLDIGILPSGDFFSFPNDKKGIEKLIKKLISLNPTRVLIESTGRIETAEKRTASDEFAEVAIK